MAGAVKAHRHAGMVSHDAHRHARIGAVGADLLRAEDRAEGRECRHIGNEPGRGHAGGGRDHVLFRNAEIEEPIGMTRLEVVRAVGGGEVGRGDDDPRVGIGQIGKFLAEHEGRHGSGRRAAHRPLVLQACLAVGGAAKNLALVLMGLVAHHAISGSYGFRPASSSAMTSS